MLLPAERGAGPARPELPELPEQGRQYVRPCGGGEPPFGRRCHGRAYRRGPRRHLRRDGLRGDVQLGGRAAGLPGGGRHGDHTGQPLVDRWGGAAEAELSRGDMRVERGCRWRRGGQRAADAVVLKLATM